MASIRTLRGVLVAVVTSVAAATSAVVGMPHAHAAPKPDAQPATWSVQPATKDGPTTRPYFEYALEPGTSVRDYVAIRNLGADKITLRLYASDAFTTEAGGYDLLTGDQAPVDVGSWVKLERDQLAIPPHGQTIVPFTLEVPPNASPGDHAGGVVASMKVMQADSSGGNVAVETRVGSRIYLRIAGPLQPGLEVKSFEASYEGSANPVQSGELHVTYTVRNSGNIRLGAGITLSTAGPAGVVGADTDLGDLPELLPGAEYTATAIVDGVWPTLRVNAELRLSPKSTSAAVTMPAITANTSVWAMPWTLLAALGLIVLVVVLRWRFSVSGSRAADAATGA